MTAIKKIFIFLFVFIWIFSGHAPIQQKIREAQAAVNWTECRTEGGETAIPASQSSANVTLATAISDVSQAFLLVDSSGNSGVSGGNDHMVSGYIANITTLTFERGGAVATAAYVTYSLVECFNDEFEVQRGEITISAGSSSNSYGGLAVVDTNRSMVVVSARTADTAAAEDDSLTTGELTDSTTILAERDISASTAATYMRYEVIEFSAGSGVSIQTNEVSLASGSANVTDTITPVAPSRTWLYCSWGAAFVGLRQSAVGCELTATDTVIFYRHATGTYTNRIRYYVVEFPQNGVVVQRSSTTHSGTGSDGVRYDKDITIPNAISATTKAFLFVTNTTQGTGAAFPRNKWIEQFTSTTNMRLSNWRANTSNANANIYWQVIEFPQPPAFDQSAYRWFENNNATQIGTAMTASQDATTTLASAGQQFRLRILMHVGTSDLPSSGENFKLQYVDKGMGTCAVPSGGTPSVYTDVTTGTTIAFNDNATPADGDALTASSTDPTHSGHTIVNQTYEEANNFLNSQGTIQGGQDGKWDFALIDNSAPVGTTYCFRIVESDGTELSSYSVYPEITTAASASVSCSVSATTTSFGTLSAGGISTATNVTSTMTCGSAAGCTLTVQDSGGSGNPGLWNASASDIILSETATLSAGTEGYGIQAATSSGGSGGLLAISPVYAKSGNDVGGLSTTPLVLASSTAAITDREVIVAHKAAISPITASGSYADTITYSCVGN